MEDDYTSVETQEQSTSPEIEDVRKKYDSFIEGLVPEGREIENYPLESKQSGYIATGKMLEDTGLDPDLNPEWAAAAKYYKRHKKAIEHIEKMRRENQGSALTTQQLQEIHKMVANEEERPGELRDEDVTTTINKYGKSIRWEYPHSERVPELVNEIEVWQKEAVKAGVNRQELGRKVAQMIMLAQPFNDANSRVADLVRQYYKD